MKKILWKILIFLWCKDICLMWYWLKHLNLKLLLDGVFFWKYKYVWNFSWTPLEHAKKFKQYFTKEEYKKNLIKWLDTKSINTVSQLEKNINLIIENKTAYFYKKDYWITEDASMIKKTIEQYTKDMYFPIKHKEETVFYYKHWIYDIPNVKNLVKWKDIIDCWAFVWDSAMMFWKEFWFSEGGVKHIYSLEPDANNMKLLKDTIIKNNMQWKIIPISLWVWRGKEVLYIDNNWIASTVWNKKNGSIIKVDTIDNIVKEYNINPWLIKWDIEWLEYDSILGAKETIKCRKPILLISIYHNWRDFYEIKPLLESRHIWYKFMVRHLSTHLFEETMLICF